MERRAAAPRRGELGLRAPAGIARRHAGATLADGAQHLGVDDTAYVVDCGDGVAQQFVLADVPLRAVRHIFTTHK